MAHTTSVFLFTDTYALLQKKNGLGDSEPQTVVISGWGLWTCSLSACCVTHADHDIQPQDPLTVVLFWEIIVHQLIRPGTSPVTLHPLKSVKPSVDLSWQDVAGEPKHCPPSCVLKFIWLRCHHGAIGRAAETLHVLYLTALTGSEITFVLTYRPDSEQQCSVRCRHTVYMFLSHREMSLLCCIFIMTVILYFGLTVSIWYSLYVQRCKIWVYNENMNAHKLNFEWQFVWQFGMFFFFRNINITPKTWLFL